MGEGIEMRIVANGYCSSGASRRPRRRWGSSEPEIESEADFEAVVAAEDDWVPVARVSGTGHRTLGLLRYGGSASGTLLFWGGGGDLTVLGPAEILSAELTGLGTVRVLAVPDGEEGEGEGEAGPGPTASPLSSSSSPSRHPSRHRSACHARVRGVATYDFAMAPEWAVPLVQRVRSVASVVRKAWSRAAATTMPASSSGSGPGLRLSLPSALSAGPSPRPRLAPFGGKVPTPPRGTVLHTLRRRSRQARARQMSRRGGDTRVLVGKAGHRPPTANTSEAGWLDDRHRRRLLSLDAHLKAQLFAEGWALEISLRGREALIVDLRSVAGIRRCLANERCGDKSFELVGVANNASHAFSMLFQARSSRVRDMWVLALRSMLAETFGAIGHGWVRRPAVRTQIESEPMGISKVAVVVYRHAVAIETSSARDGDLFEGVPDKYEVKHARTENTGRSNAQRIHSFQSPSLSKVPRNFATASHLETAEIAARPNRKGGETEEESMLKWIRNFCCSKESPSLRSSVIENLLVPVALLPVAAVLSGFACWILLAALLTMLTSYVNRKSTAARGKLGEWWCELRAIIWNAKIADSLLIQRFESDPNNSCKLPDDVEATLGRMAGLGIMGILLVCLVVQHVSRNEARGSISGLVAIGCITLITVIAYSYVFNFVREARKEHLLDKSEFHSSRGVVNGHRSRYVNEVSKDKDKLGRSNVMSESKFTTPSSSALRNGKPNSTSKLEAKANHSSTLSVPVRMYPPQAAAVNPSRNGSPDFSQSSFKILLGGSPLNFPGDDAGTIQSDPGELPRVDIAAVRRSTHSSTNLKQEIKQRSMNSENKHTGASTL